MWDESCWRLTYEYQGSGHAEHVVAVYADKPTLEEVFSVVVAKTPWADTKTPHTWKSGGSVLRLRERVNTRPTEKPPETRTLTDAEKRVQVAI